MFNTEIPWLTAIIFFPLLGALMIPVIPDKEGKRVRLLALTVGLTNFIFIVYAFWKNYSINNTAFQLQESYAWLPQLGINWSVGIDGLSMPLILLSSFIRRWS